MWIPNFILRWIGKDVGKKLDLQEDVTMDGTKKWYQSKTIWSAVAVAFIGIYNAISQIKQWPPIPEWIYTLLAAMNIYTRSTATDKIS